MLFVPDKNCRPGENLRITRKSQHSAKIDLNSAVNHPPLVRIDSAMKKIARQRQPPRHFAVQNVN